MASPASSPTQQYSWTNNVTLGTIVYYKVGDPRISLCDWTDKKTGKTHRVLREDGRSREEKAQDQIAGIAEFEQLKRAEKAKEKEALREKLEAAHFELAGVAGGEFAKMAIEPREVLIAENNQPVFYTQSLNQIIAWRGVGKTVFALGMAGALTSGGQLLKFKAARPSKVMYIDGELPLYQMQERIRDLIPEHGRDNFYLINAEMSPSRAPIDLGNPKMWDSLRRRLDTFKPDVLILDSRSTLFPSMESNKEDHQGMLQTRFQELRLRKLCVIEAHHLDKNGLQRGHSKNDDALDVQMKLGKPDDWEPGQGLRFVLGYEKVRHSANLDSDYQVTFNKSWKTFERSDFTVEQLEIASRLDAGQSYQQITKELGASSRTIAKVANKRKKMATAPDTSIPY